jgi:hypothetical protein
MTQRMIGRPRSATGLATPPQVLIGLVGRLLIAQSAASAAIGLGYSRRNLPWLLLTIVVALALCGLAALVRSGGQVIWQLAISAESILVAIGLFRFVYARYMGGTLLAIVGLGTLLHPAVARAFAATPRWRGTARPRDGLADEAADVLPGRATG